MQNPSYVCMPTNQAVEAQVEFGVLISVHKLFIQVRSILDKMSSEKRYWVSIVAQTKANGETVQDWIQFKSRFNAEMASLLQRHNILVTIQS